jgi:hypothetical protein
MNTPRKIRNKMIIKLVTGFTRVAMLGRMGVRRVAFSKDEMQRSVKMY